MRFLLFCTVGIITAFVVKRWVEKAINFGDLGYSGVLDGDVGQCSDPYPSDSPESRVNVRREVNFVN